jgi:hypothetical protein
MPYSILWNGDVFHKPFTGIVTDSEFLQSADKTHGDPHFDALRYAINDFSGVREFQFLPNTFEKWAAKTLGSSFTNHHIHAIFVTTDDSVKKAISNVKAIAEGHFSIHIFSSLEAAKAWISTDKSKSI